MKRIAAVFMGLCLGLIACSPDEKQATEVVLELRAEALVAQRVRRLRVQVQASPGDQDTEVWAERSDQELVAPSFPLRVALVPRQGDASRVWQVIVTARAEDGAFVAQARVISGYVPNSIRYARLLLENACIDVEGCAESQSCRAGSCVDARADVAQFSSEPTMPVRVDTLQGAAPADAGQADARAHTGNDAGGDGRVAPEPPAAATCAELGACMPHGHCIESSDGARCVCDSQFMLGSAGSCVPVAAVCKDMPCDNQGICKPDSAGGRSCDCSTVDFDGPTCAQHIDDCAALPCENGGVCADGVRKRSCDCSATDFEGASCESRVDDCALTPCAHGSCTDRVRSRLCDCTDSGFTGSTCELNINECATGQANVCSGRTGVVAFDYACTNFDADTPYYTCQGQFADWEPSAPGNSFSATNGVVQDSHTRLSWQQKVFVAADVAACGSTDAPCLQMVVACGNDAACTWDQAKKYCANLTLGSFGDWRLPSRAELESIVDLSLINPAHAGLSGAFAGAPTANYWTASPDVADATSAWVINFYSGRSQTNPVDETNPARVRCVR
ncbi:MAG: uncharacterized protein JWN48_6036 [Myxococcaceae bacterium]|nr:uncharacterized protein [Myxococcaceae bacterium]